MKHDEFRIHVAILEHIRSAFPQVKAFHIANQSKDAKEAFWNKKLGVEPGASDLIFGWKPSRVGVLEVKAAEGKISTAQNKFLSWADSINWNTGVARSVSDAHRVLKSWGLIPLYNETHEPDLRTFDDKKRDAFNLYKPKDKP